MVGLIQKFKVERMTESSRGVDHSECRYFVLDPQHDSSAWAALWDYAERIQRDEPELAKDLFDWLRWIVKSWSLEEWE